MTFTYASIIFIMKLNGKAELAPFTVGLHPSAVMISQKYFIWISLHSWYMKNKETGNIFLFRSSTSIYKFTSFSKRRETVFLLLLPLQILLLLLQLWLLITHHTLV